MTKILLSSTGKKGVKKLYAKKRIKSLRKIDVKNWRNLVLCILKYDAVFEEGRDFCTQFCRLSYFI